MKVFLLQRLLPAAALAFFCFSGKIFSQCDAFKDSVALAQFYTDTDGDNWGASTNWLVAGKKIDEWLGINTDNTTGCVTEIILIGNQITGPMDALGNLSSLEKIILSQNQINSLPASLGLLYELNELRLDNNPLSSQIPDFSQAAKLEILSLNNCGLTGVFPSSLTDAAALQKILLANNTDLTGGLPPNLDNLLNLNELVLNGCSNLGGNLPPEMGNLANLKNLQLSGCQIGGDIPASFGDLTGIGNLNLFNNQLVGCLPPELKNLCPTPAIVNISSNLGLDNDNWQLFCDNDAGICTSCPPITAEFDSDNSTPKLCKGNDGQITFIIEGGSPGYTVKYSAGSTIFTETDYESGDLIFIFPNTNTTYTLLEVTDAEGCPADVSGQIFTISVSSGNPPSPSISVQKPDCFGNDNLILKALASTAVEWNWEGPDGFIFSGDSEAVILDANEFNSGDYFLTVTDAFGCTGEAEIYVDIIPRPQIGIIPLNFVCEGQNLTIFAENFGNADDYTWKWTGPGFFEDSPEFVEIPAAELKNGIYTVVITDDLSKCTASDFVEISLTPPPFFSNPDPTAANAGQANGSISFDLSGVEPFSLQWQPGGGMQTNVFAGQTLLENLKAGNYSMTITDNDGFGCTAVATFTISENSIPCSIALAAPIVLPPDCLGGSNGSISIAATGAVGSLHWFWSGANNFTSTSQNLQNLPAGNYTCTATEANGCTATAAATLADGTAPIFAVAPQNPATIGQSNGSALLQISSGTAPFSATWTGGSNLQNLPLGQTQLANLAAKNYTCTLTDAKGCTATADFTVAENPIKCTIAGGAATATPVRCFGGTDGSIAQTFTGGTAPFVFDWNFDPADGQQNPQNLPKGNYSCTISGADGCSVVQSATVAEPPVLLVPLPTAVAENCLGQSNGSISIVPTGGTPPLKFDWKNSSGFSSTSQNLQNLAPADYFCTISDANGCTAVAVAGIAAGSSLPVVGIVQPSGSQLNCLFSSLDLIASSPSANIFQWSGGASGSTLKVSAAGTFFVTATDAKGCSGTTSAVVTADFSLPQISLAVPPPPQLTCSMPTVFLVGSSTTAGASFAWTGPNGFSAATAAVEISQPGLYFLKIFGQNGCSESDSATVVKSADLPAPPKIETPDGQFFDCKNLTLQLVASGAAAGSILEWTAAVGGGTGANFTATQPGIYVLKITAANGCTATTSINLTEKKALPQSLAAKICEGQTFDFAGKTLAASGVFFDTLKTSNGCDSVWRRLDLAVLKNSTTSLDRKICEGETFNFAGQLLDSAGVFSKKYVSAAGCDSTVTLALAVFPKRSTLLDRTICEGETFDFAGQNLATTGIFKKQFQTAAGCDSVVTLDLKVNPQPTIVTAQDGAILSIQELELVLPVLFNDSIEKDIWGSLTILSPPASGSVERSGDTLFYEQTDLDFSGNDVFTYQICGAGCPKICDTAQVVLRIANKKIKDLGDVIHNVLTPDNASDGNYFDPVRDLRAENFEVERAELTIFNRWGDRVFYAETEGETQPSWDGFFNQNMPAAEGAYFFVLHTFAKNVRTTFSGAVNVLR